MLFDKMLLKKKNLHISRGASGLQVPWL